MKAGPSAHRDGSKFIENIAGSLALTKLMTLRSWPTSIARRPAAEPSAPIKQTTVTI